MKKSMICLLAAALLLLGGCGKQKNEEKAAVPTVQIAYAAYQYDQGYELADGWVYEMTVPSGVQMTELKKLTDGLTLEMLDRTFEYGRAYRLIFRDAAGSVTQELLVMEDGMVSMDGMLYRAEAEQPLLAWLDGLQIEEQEIE